MNHNVLHILNSINLGGAERLTLDILHAAARQGNPYHFITFCKGSLNEEFMNCNCFYNHIPRKKIFEFITIHKLRKYIKKHDIKIVHTHFITDAFYVQLAIFGLKTQHAHTYHGFLRKLPLRFKLALRFVIPRINMNIFVSDELCQSREKHFRYFKSYCVIENGINTNIKPEKIDIRNELKLNSSFILFGMIGNFVNTGRDQLTVCKAINVLIKRGYNLYFLFIGRKDENNTYFFDECYNYCKDNQLDVNVFFLGLRKDALSILTEFDAYVYASNHDTFGISIIEAMFLETPVFVNNLPPFLQITRNGSFANIYETKNYMQLADYLEQYIKQPIPYLEMAKLAKKHIIANYSIDRVLQQYENVYENLVSVSKSF